MICLQRNKRLKTALTQAGLNIASRKSLNEAAFFEGTTTWLYMYCVKNIPLTIYNLQMYIHICFKLNMKFPLMYVVYWLTYIKYIFTFTYLVFS